MANILSEALVSLTPANALAKLAFSEVFGALDDMDRDETNDHAFHRMVVIDLKIFDDGVRKLRRMSQGMTVETDQQLGQIWPGHYELRLRPPPPYTQQMGYTIGMGPQNQFPLDMFLCTPDFARHYGIDLQTPHAEIGFFIDSGQLYIAPGAFQVPTQLTVNGKAISPGTRYPLSKNYEDRMTVHFGDLQYTLQKKPYTEDMRRHCLQRRYWDHRNNLKQYPFGVRMCGMHYKAPLPRQRTIGEWLQVDGLEPGVNGMTFVGTSQQGEIAALKILERTPERFVIVDAEVETCRAITEFARKHDSGWRMQRVIDVLYAEDENYSSSQAFGCCVALIHQPLTPRTFADLCLGRGPGEPKGMTTAVAQAFREALLGVQTMHQGGWMHRDLKLTNIGLVDISFRILLMNIGTSAYLPRGLWMRPTPGGVGTAGFAAPETEYGYYNHTVDIWAMGIILYYLTYHEHPWGWAMKSWHEIRESEELEQYFHTCYDQAITRMMQDYHESLLEPSEGYIHLGPLFVEMVRYQWEPYNYGTRPPIEWVLSHPLWDALERETAQTAPVVAQTAPNVAQTRQGQASNSGRRDSAGLNIMKLSSILG